MQSLEFLLIINISSTNTPSVKCEDSLRRGRICAAHYFIVRKQGHRCLCKKPHNLQHNANYVIINLEPEKRAFTQEDQSAQIQFIYLICGKRVVLHLLAAAENIAMQKRIYVVPAP